jgi:hypothetical protein
MEPQINMFVSENGCGSLDEARMAVISLRVSEQDGTRHVWLDGEWSDVVQALLYSDVIIVTISSPDNHLAEA